MWFEQLDRYSPVNLEEASQEVEPNNGEVAVVNSLSGKEEAEGVVML